MFGCKLMESCHPMSREYHGIFATFVGVPQPQKRLVVVPVGVRGKEQGQALGKAAGVQLAVLELDGVPRLGDYTNIKNPLNGPNYVEIPYYINYSFWGCVS